MAQVAIETGRGSRVRTARLGGGFGPIGPTTGARKVPEDSAGTSISQYTLANSASDEKYCRGDPLAADASGPLSARRLPPTEQSVAASGQSESQRRMAVQ